jgi:hypothetical protein
MDQGGRQVSVQHARAIWNAPKRRQAKHAQACTRSRRLGGGSLELFGAIGQNRDFTASGPAESNVAKACPYNMLECIAAMVFDHIEQLKREWTDKYVIADTSRPELARFKGMTGVVKTVNMNGRALVQFDGNSNIGWYDIALDYLKVVPQPLPKAAEPKEKAAAARAPAKPAVAATKPEPPAKKASTAEILAAARGARPATPPAEAPETKPAKKLSTSEVLAAARGKAAAPAAPAEQVHGTTNEKPPQKPVGAATGAKLSTAEVLAAARGQAGASKTATPGPPPPAEPPAAIPTETPEPTVAAVAQAAPPAAAPAKKGPAESGALPKTTAEKIAYCRRVDAKG